MQDLPLSVIMDRLDKASIRAKISFYVRFVKELTITNRAVWSDITLTAEQKVEQLKWINEIIHRAVNRLQNLVTSDQKTTEREIWDLIQDHVFQNKDIAPAVSYAIRGSFNSLFS